MKRKSIYIEGFSHGNNPVPAGCVMGGTLVTGAIFGADPATGKVAASVEDQVRLTFVNAGRILEAAGSSFEQVIKMTFYLRPEVDRQLINQHWVELFPDADSRPARHVIVSDRIPASQHVQCDLLACVNDGRQQ